MPDIDPSIPLKAVAPASGMSSLKDVLGVAGAIQGYQTGQIEQQRTGVALEQEQGKLAARKAVGAIIADPQYRTADGTYDLNAIGPAIYSADPNIYHAKDAIGALTQYNNDTINVKKNALSLSDSARGVVASAIGSLANDPQITSAKVLDVMDTLKKQSPVTAPIVDIWRTQLDRPEFADPRKLQAFVMNARSQVMPPTAQIESQTPAGLPFNTGQVSGLINTRPTAGATGPVPGTLTQNVVPPMSAEQVGTDAFGNPVRVVRDARGVLSLEPMNTRGGATAPGAGGAPAPMYSFPAGESPQTKQALEGERQVALTTLTQAPLLHATNRGVLEEIDRTAATGTPGPKLQALFSTLGVAFSTQEQKASAYDLVGKYLERNALQAAQGMGPNTNAGLEAQIKANGSVAYNPTAIKKITRLNDALVTGVETYQPGLEKAIQGSPDQIFAKRRFDQQWAQNFDPRAMQIFNAAEAAKEHDAAANDPQLSDTERKDLQRKAADEKREQADLTRGLSKAESEQLARKAKNIETLSRQGHL
jgi:hypothetical protein